MNLIHVYHHLTCTLSDQKSNCYLGICKSVHLYIWITVYLDIFEYLRISLNICGWRCGVGGNHIFQTSGYLDIGISVHLDIRTLAYLDIFEYLRISLNIFKDIFEYLWMEICGVGGDHIFQAWLSQYMDIWIFGHWHIRTLVYLGIFEYLRISLWISLNICGWRSAGWGGIRKCGWRR